MKLVVSPDHLVHYVFSEAAYVDSVITLCTAKPWHRAAPFDDPRQVRDAWPFEHVTCLRCATGVVNP